MSEGELVSEGGLPGTVKKTAADVRRLAKLQAELMRQKFQTQAKRKGIFAGLGASGGLFLVYGLLFGLGAAAAGLAVVVPVWLALLIVAGALLFLAGLLMAVGGLGLKGRKARSLEASKEGVDGPWLPAKSS